MDRRDKDREAEEESGCRMCGTPRIFLALLTETSRFLGPDSLLSCDRRNSRVFPSGLSSKGKSLGPA